MYRAGGLEKFYCISLDNILDKFEILTCLVKKYIFGPKSYKNYVCNTETTFSAAMPEWLSG